MRDLFWARFIWFSRVIWARAARGWGGGGEVRRACCHDWRIFISTSPGRSEIPLAENDMHQSIFAVNVEMCWIAFLEVRMCENYVGPSLSPPQKIGRLNFFRIPWEVRWNVMVSKQTFHWCNLPFFQLEPNVCYGLKFPYNFRNTGIQLLVYHVDFELLAHLIDKLLSNFKLPVKFSFQGGNENSSVMAASSPYLTTPAPILSGSYPNLGQDPNKSRPK